MATLEQLNLRKLWVEALRSGEYKQGFCFLKQLGKDGEFKYCCLGVLCELAKAKWKGGFESDYIKSELYTYGSVSVLSCEESGVRTLPRSVMEKVGIKDITGNFGTINLPCSLASLNDTGKTFNAIADIIESNPEGLWED